MEGYADQIEEMYKYEECAVSDEYIANFKAAHEKLTGKKLSDLDAKEKAIIFFRMIKAVYSDPQDKEVTHDLLTRIQEERDELWWEWIVVRCRGWAEYVYPVLYPDQIRNIDQELESNRTQPQGCIPSQQTLF